jgi:hypothetical protein
MTVPLLRITQAVPLAGHRLRLTLTDGSIIERDVAHLLVGPMLDEIRRDRRLFEGVSVEAGTVAWPNGADLCPDTIIWGGLPPADTDAHPPP